MAGGQDRAIGDSTTPQDAIRHTDRTNPAHTVWVLETLQTLGDYTAHMYSVQALEVHWLCTSSLRVIHVVREPPDWRMVLTLGQSRRKKLTPTGKPPPLAVRLAKALPFRRAQIEMRDTLTVHDDLHTADGAHACARVGVDSDHMARQGRRYGT